MLNANKLVTLSRLDSDPYISPSGMDADNGQDILEEQWKLVAMFDFTRGESSALGSIASKPQLIAGIFAFADLGLDGTLTLKSIQKNMKMRTASGMLTEKTQPYNLTDNTKNQPLNAYGLMVDVSSKTICTILSLDQYLRNEVNGLNLVFSQELELVLTDNSGNDATHKLNVTTEVPDVWLDYFNLFDEYNLVPSIYNAIIDHDKDRWVEGLIIKHSKIFYDAAPSNVTSLVNMINSSITSGQIPGEVIDDDKIGEAIDEFNAFLTSKGLSTVSTDIDGNMVDSMYSLMRDLDQQFADVDVHAVLEAKSISLKAKSDDRIATIRSVINNG